MARTSLPPGFRFHPTDVELIMYYLKRKVLGKKLHFEAIADVEIYKYAPWDLPDKSCLRTRDLKWYFYCAIEKKYASGLRMNRATDFGYWKSTGKDRAVRYDDDVVGMIKTLVFHRGKAPKGDRTDWVMYEYRLEDKKLAESGAVQDSYVLCVLFKKDGPGPNIGAQYGAPFKEEEWEYDDDDAVAGEEHNGGEDLAHVGVSVPAFILPNNQNSPQAPYVPEGMHIGSSPLCPAEAMPSGFEPIPGTSHVDVASAEPRPSTYEQISLIPTNDVASGEPPNVAYGDDISEMLRMFSEGAEFTLNENYNESTGSINHGGNVLADPFEDGLNIYDLMRNLGNFPASGHGDLGYFPAHEHGDLGYLPAYEHGYQDNFPGHEHGSNIPNYPMDPMDQGQFLELTDLEVPLHSAQVCHSDNVQTGGFYVNNYHNNSVQLFSPANPCPASDPITGFSQLPILHGGQYGFDSQLNRFSKDDSVYGNHFHQ